MIKLIINADDFGFSNAIDSAILNLCASGGVTSTTLMVNGETAILACNAIKQYPHVSLGLHINLTEGFPVSRDCQTLIKPETGCFYHRDDLFKRCLFGKLNIEDVNREIVAQFNRFVEIANQMPSHFDSHQHTHVLPTIDKAVVLLAKETRIPVRLPNEPIIVNPQRLHTVISVQLIRKILLSFYAYQFKKLLIQNEIPHNQAFMSFFSIRENSSVEAKLKKCLEHLPAGMVTEFMVHPLLYDESLINFWETKSLLMERVEETIALQRITIAESLADKKVELISYHQLTESLGITKQVHG